MTNIQNTKRFLNDAIIKDISDAIESLSDGQVNIMVSQQKIIQIDVAERKRFDDVWEIEDGAGI
jgi:hypothetical protein